LKLSRLEVTGGAFLKGLRTEGDLVKNRGKR
jgi:hypothetical protein